MTDCKQWTVTHIMFKRAMTVFLSAAIAFTAIPFTCSASAVADCCSYTASTISVDMGSTSCKLTKIKTDGISKMWTGKITKHTVVSGEATRTVLAHTTVAAKLVYYYGYKKGYGTGTKNAVKLARALTYNYYPKSSSLTKAQIRAAKEMIDTAKRWTIPAVLNMKVYKYTPLRKYNKDNVSFIGYVTSRTEVKVGITYGKVAVKSALKNSYASVVHLPYVTTKSAARKNLDSVDALCVPGGVDINPALYGQKNQYSKDIDNARDKAEKLYMQAAIRRDMPMLCICRGAQMLNVVNGGTLYQDIPKQIRNNIKHKNAYHKVIFRSGFLKAVFGNSAKPKSYHHQCVRKLGSNMKITARTSDGVVEGTQMTNRTFVVGVQFHPEFSVKYSRYCRLFDRFVREGATYKKERKE